MQPLRKTLAQLDRKAQSTSRAATFLATIPLLWNFQVAAVETVLWKLGEVDRSDHEFSAIPDSKTNRPVTVRIGSGDELRHWPKFHPGTGNGAFGGRPYRFSLTFDLPAEPRGVFYLELSLLFRQPRVPALVVEINGYRGCYYFNPDPMFELGAVEDEFNATRSVQHRKLPLPASLFHAGENLVTFIAVDDPPTVINNRNVGGSGDSGFFYDSLALTQDPDAVFDEKLGVSLIPTIFFHKTAEGVKEECQLTVRHSNSWRGGKARVTIGKFTAHVEATPPGEFGEARCSFLIPDNEPASTARIQLSAADGGAPNASAFEVKFVPARKWKLFYAPNEHMDVGYTDFRAKVAELHARNMDDLLPVLKAHPQYRFNVDGGWIPDQWLDARAARYTAQLAPFARDGRVGVNAFYCCPATEYPSLEENIRNLYFSKELQTHFGIPADFALISDVPSCSWSVPSVLASAGVRYFANGANQDRGPMVALGHWNVRSPFWWEGPDGQRVLAWFSAHYHQLKALCGLPPTIDSGKGGIARFLRAYEQSGYTPDAVLVYGTEVENLPAEYDDASFVEKWNAEFAWPQIVTCRFSEFFEYIEKHYGGNLPVVRGTGGAYWADNFGMLPAATARDRANQMRAVSSETVAAFTTAFDPKLRFAHELDGDIWRNIMLFAEHNFGTGRAGYQPESDEVVGVITEKEAFTQKAEADIDALMRRSMSQLGNQIQTEGQDLIVFNPLIWTRSALVHVQVDDGTTLTDVARGKAVDYEVIAEKDGYQTIRFWAAGVPAMGYRVYRLGHGKAQHAPPVEPPGDNVVENRFYKITLEPSRAAIRSIFDKELGRELVDSFSPFLANEYIFVSGGGTDEGRGRGQEDSRLLHPFHWLPQAELTIHHSESGVLAEIEKTPWGQKILMTASALHTPRIETEILLPDEVKRIEFHDNIQVDLLYAKQASYFAFPWAMLTPMFRYDIPNGFVDPAKDLLDGGCNDWFSVQHWVNVEDKNFSVTLAPVDAPLVCLGDINRGWWSRHFTNDTAAVFSYALNNYWSPKWAGKKSAELSFRYVITSDARFDGMRAARLGREARNGLEISTIKSSDKLPGLRGKLPPGEASFATLEPENLVMVAFKPAEDGKGLVARLLETAGRDTEGTLALPFITIASANEANAVEVAGKALQMDGNAVRFHVHSYQVITIRLTPAKGRAVFD